MSNATRLRRSAILGALAFALLGTITSSVADAQTTDDAAIARALAQERYYDPPNTQLNPHRPRSDDSPQLTAAQLRAIERHYSSYGEPEPIAAPVTPAPADDTPWLTIALTAAVALAAASIAAIHRRRLRLRRRVARAAT